MSTIGTVIHSLGYHNSKKLFYLSEFDKCTDLSWHDRRVLCELAPYAAYVIDGHVLTVFFNIPLSVAECFLKIFSTEKRVVLINISYFL